MIEDKLPCLVEADILGSGNASSTVSKIGDTQDKGVGRGQSVTLSTIITDKYASPTAEELTSYLHHSTVFSKMALDYVYLQVPLSFAALWGFANLHTCYLNFNQL